MSSDDEEISLLFRFEAKLIVVVSRDVRTCVVQVLGLCRWVLFHLHDASRSRIVSQLGLQQALLEQAWSAISRLPPQPCILEGRSTALIIYASSILVQSATQHRVSCSRGSDNKPCNYRRSNPQSPLPPHTIGDPITPGSYWGCATVRHGGCLLIYPT